MGPGKRRQAIQTLLLKTITASAAAATAALLQTQSCSTPPTARTVINAWEFEAQTDQLLQIKSSNQLAQNRTKQTYLTFKQNPVTKLQAQQALQVVLNLRGQIERAEEFAKEKNWNALDRALPITLVHDMEVAATTLYHSNLLDTDQRAAIGWDNH